MTTKVIITKRCYTLFGGTRVVESGTYEASSFSKEEMDYLTSLNAVKQSAKPKPKYKRKVENKTETEE